MLSVTAIGASQLKTLRASEVSPTERGSLAKKDLSRIILTVDQLYEANEMEKALDFLERYCESREVEVLWRLARLSFKV